MSDIELHAALDRALVDVDQAPALHVAFSGGLDSTVLLHLLADLRQRRSLPPLSAIHVHHGLQAAADAWPEHCRRVCEALVVPLHVERVQVSPDASLEQAARQARYAAFTRRVGGGEWLLSAQHRDDQAETLLFRLLRGAGVRGLASMASRRGMGRGWLVRPLLEVPRDVLESYARHHGLSWVEDPSNQQTQHDRNFLRRQVLPLLQSRWPQAAHNLARTAGHMAEAQQLLDELAVQDLQAARPADDFPWLDVPRLALAPLCQLSAARQRNALRHWLAALTRLPDSRHWAGWDALRNAAPDAHPVWCLGDGEVHRAAGQLWWLSGDWLSDPGAGLSWQEAGVPLSLPGNGALRFEGQAPPGRFEVRYRQGGEVMSLAGRGQRDLKRLLNERTVPGFVRRRLPLLFQGDRLLAVAGIAGLDRVVADGGRLVWQAPMSKQSLR